MDLAGKNPFSVEIDEGVMEQSIDEIIDITEKLFVIDRQATGIPKIEYVKHVGTSR